MKVSYKPRPSLLVEFDAQDVKTTFEYLAQIDEILGQERCGKCKNEKLAFQVREVDGNKFYELRCKACGAVLGFGSHKKGGTLFPQRKDAEGDFLPDGGWTKWNPKTQQKE